jgi:hypothetical protein
MSNPEFLRESRAFLKKYRFYWLAPIIIVLSLAGAVLFFMRNEAVAPFSYTMEHRAH